MPKNILLATDLTARGDRPFARAKLLADIWGADRTVLFVADTKIAVDRAKVEKDLERNYGADAKQCHLEIQKGSPPKVIAKTAERLGSDLIIVGAARHNNISQCFLGKAVNHLVRNVAVPILIVKERPRGHYQRILVTTDFSDCSAHALHTALKAFPKAKIALVNAYHVPYEAWLKSDETANQILADAQKAEQNFMAGLNLSAVDAARISSHLVEGNLHQSVYEMLHSGDFGLLVVGAHGRSGFVVATIGSRASEMMDWSPVDVLVVRKPA